VVAAAVLVLMLVPLLDGQEDGSNTTAGGQSPVGAVTRRTLRCELLYYRSQEINFLSGGAGNRLFRDVPCLLSGVEHLSRFVCIGAVRYHLQS
jgi:hypothetical protein